MAGLLEGRAVIVTGAASGVGRAAAGLFAEHGARLLCADVDAAGLQAMGDDGFATMRTDVSKDAEVAALIASAVERFGRLDVIYNNVGVASTSNAAGLPLPLDECADADLDRLMSINVGGVFHGCKHAIRQYRRQSGPPGVIVNTASVAGLIGWGGVLYGASKGAVVALTRALAMEVAPLGIRVNSVCPAAMITKFGGGGGAQAASPEKVAAYGRTHPLGRPIDPMDCAEAALFLASDLAKNITGVNLPVDGGLAAGRGGTTTSQPAQPAA